MAERDRDTSNDVAQDMTGKLGSAGTGGNGSRNSLQNKSKRAARKGLKNVGKKLAQAGGKKALLALGKAALAIGKIALMIIIKLLPFIVAGLLLWGAFLLVSGWFVDDNYESKAKLEILQNESSGADNDTAVDEETGEVFVQARSDANMMYKIFYGYVAQKGYWKVIVDKNGKQKGELVRGDTKEAQEITDKYNREKNFVLNSDLLYLLDTELHAGLANDFYFPEQFTQAVPYDKNFNLIDLIDEDGEITTKSTKYDEKGKPTNKKVEGIWDYGFGSVLQYQEFKEDREKRGNLDTTYYWDFDAHELKKRQYKAGEGKKIKERVLGYPMDTHMIRKVTFPIGSIENTIVSEWVETAEVWTKTETIEIKAEKLETYQIDLQEINSKGEPLYWAFNPILFGKAHNIKIKEVSPWPVTFKVDRQRWVPTTKEVEQTYKGKVWEKVPRYEGEPNTDGIVGDKYFYDYLTSYEAYIPDNVMEEFDIQERTGRDIEELEEIFNNQMELENADSEYDNVDGDETPGEGEVIDVGAGITGPRGNFDKAMRYFPHFEKYGEMYGVDPYILVAKAAQESGGDHERHKNPNSGYGIMQIEQPGRVMTGASAFNLQTGQVDKMTISGPSAISNVEDNIKAGTMIFATRAAEVESNVLIALQGYNYGPAGINTVLRLYSEASGKTVKQIQKDTKDTGWMAYREQVHLDPNGTIGKYNPSFNWTKRPTFGDPKYIENVLRYYNSTGGTPYIISKEGTKYSMDGSIEVGASVVAGGGGGSRNWFTRLIEIASGVWDELFEETPVDTLANKKDYKWHHHKNRLSEAEAEDFMKVYMTFVNNTYFSEVEEMSVDDWKQKYKILFENPPQEGVVNNQMSADYMQVMELLGHDYKTPIKNIDGLSKEFDGTMVRLNNKANTEVLAATSGTIQKVDKTNGILEIASDAGGTIRYTNLRNITVKNGDEVKSGKKIAVAKGAIGFSIKDNRGDHMNPTPLFSIHGGGTFIRPTTGSITSSFGIRNDPFTGKRTGHAGIDYGAPTGTPVLAGAKGKVTTARYMDGFGNVIFVHHPDLNLTTVYAHLSKIHVKVGQEVGVAEHIGDVGSTGRSTGPHLHFEVHIGHYGANNAVDPMLYI